MISVSKLIDILSSEPDQSLYVMLPDGAFIPAHFHVTEVGQVHKRFVDCGGKRRISTHCSLQIWVANDTHHRLGSHKLLKIMAAAKPILETMELPVEIEFETESVASYPLAGIELTPSGVLFVTGKKHTECLAPDKCGVGECCKEKRC